MEPKSYVKWVEFLLKFFLLLFGLVAVFAHSLLLLLLYDMIFGG